MKIACEHPNIIFNPKIKWLFCCKGYRHFDLNGRMLDYICGNWFNFPWFELYQVKDSVTPDNIGSYVFCDDDGLCEPLFMLVPCGKCRLCRDKKCDDWCTRCLCETASSDFPPLFITLTYKPECRPETADQCKEDFQKFMKRLRINVSRHLDKKDSELRYFARSEKTPKHGYWHIHMLLWNMPFVSCAEGDRNSFQTLIRYIQETCWQNGICRVERCRDGSGAYCMKYARKEDCNPEYWQLASRRNGIGYKFAANLLPQVLANPDLMTFRIPGQTKSFPIPSYFKRIWFPTLSVLFPADVCKAAKDFLECSVKLRWFMSYYGDSWANRCSDIEEMLSDVSQKYDIMHLDFSTFLPNRHVQREIDQYCHLRDSVGTVRFAECRKSVVMDKWILDDDGQLKDIRIYHGLSGGDDRIIPLPSKASTASPACYYFRLDMIQAWNLLKRSYAILEKYEFDRDEFVRRLAITASHQEYVRSVVEQLPDVNVDDLVSLSVRDAQWRETHWMQQEIG